MRILIIEDERKTVAFLNNGSAGAIHVQVGDELRNENNHHQHGASYGLAAKHRDQGGHGNENLGADFAFAYQVDQAGFYQRI